MTSISFYIPSISANITTEQVVEAFSDFGEVLCVDFKPAGRKHGFIEKDATFKSAFVHLINVLEKGSRINNWIRGGEPYKFCPYSDGEYWNLMPARTPIQNTMINNTQILEKKVEEQAAKIRQQADIIAQLTKKLEDLQKQL